MTSKDPRRTQRVEGEGNGWEIARHVPTSASDFSQRLTVTFADEDTTMIGTSQISYDNETWTDELALTYCRVT